jgi:hypothetical protein
MADPINRKLSSRAVLKADMEEFINRELVPVVEKLRLFTDAVAGVLQDGEGDPNGVVTASRPALYFDTTGGTGAALYYKTTDDSDTGWVALP